MKKTAFNIQHLTNNKKSNNLLAVICYLLSEKKGFTLIELLVVVAVMAFLMTLFFPNFMSARERARDTQRKSDLKQIQSALELYKSDQNPVAYPTDASGYFPAGLCSQCWSSAADCGGNIYMRKMPCDPANLNPTPYVYTRNDTIRYTLSACLENPVDPDKDITGVPACGTDGTSYTVHEP